MTEVFVTQTIYNSKNLEGRRFFFFFVWNGSSSFAQKKWAMSVWTQIWSVQVLGNAMFVPWTRCCSPTQPFCLTDDFVAPWQSARCLLDLSFLWAVGRGQCRVTQEMWSCCPCSTPIRKFLRASKLNKTMSLSSNVYHNWVFFWGSEGMACKTILSPVKLWEIRPITITVFSYFPNHLKQLVLRTFCQSKQLVLRTFCQSLHAGHPSLLFLVTYLELFLTLFLGIAGNV